jgi:hypothetical protein
MIAFSFDRVHSLLLVNYDTELTHDNLDALDVRLATFVAQHGTADTIMDFRNLNMEGTPTSVLFERGQRPSRMPGRKRVFLISGPLMTGLFRLYGAHQDNAGVQPPILVQTLKKALEVVGAPDATFEHLSL